MSRSSPHTGLWVIREERSWGMAFFSGRVEALGARRWDSDPRRAQVFRTKAIALKAWRALGRPGEVIDLSA